MVQVVYRVRHLPDRYARIRVRRVRLVEVVVVRGVDMEILLPGESNLNVRIAERIKRHYGEGV